MSNNSMYLIELYKIFISSINNVDLQKKRDKKYIIKCIENYLDNSVLNNYSSKYEMFEYIYDVELSDTKY